MFHQMHLFLYKLFSNLHIIFLVLFLTTYTRFFKETNHQLNFGCIQNIGWWILSNILHLGRRIPKFPKTVHNSLDFSFVNEITKCAELGSIWPRAAVSTRNNSQPWGSANSCRTDNKPRTSTRLSQGSPTIQLVIPLGYRYSWEIPLDWETLSHRTHSYPGR
jgi:hypothetical protein